MLKKQDVVALYLRLSRDDGGDSESNSIGNQREILQKYAHESGFTLTREYADLYSSFLIQCGYAFKLRSIP